VLTAGRPCRHAPSLPDTLQVISQRYEQGSILLTTNQPYKHWPKIFNNDSTLTSAVLDRLLHHAETVILEGKSYRMKDQIETP
jgi:DNA replication protein DnaC